jgi:carbon starvation protein CstA
LRLYGRLLHPPFSVPWKAFGNMLRIIILQVNFDVLWRYFAWCNQTLAVFTLWAITVYLCRTGKLYVLSLIPAIFMTMVCSTYLFAASRPEGLGLSYTISQTIGLAVVIVVVTLFFLWKKNLNRKSGRGFITEIKLIPNKKRLNLNFALENVSMCDNI